MMRAAWGAAAAVLGAGIAFFATETVGEARRYATAPALTETVTAEGPRGFPLAAGGGPLAGAAGPGRAVVMLYVESCGPSADNMWNWIDAVGAADPDVRFYAAAPDSGAEVVPEYWGALERRVTVVRDDARALGELLRVTSTPATVLVEDGRVRRTFVGPLTPAARREVLRFVGRRPPAG